MGAFSRIPAPAKSPSPDDPLKDIWPSAPGWVVALIVGGVAAAALLVSLKPLLQAVRWGGGRLVRLVRPRSRDESFRFDRYRRFARFVVSQLDLLAAKEDWHDQRFAELAADVEMEGRIRALRWLSASPIRTVALRRERSLTRAIGRSTEPVIILEGDPGAGKSVALRHVAHVLARRAQRRFRRGLPVIPLYVNLKEFRPENRPASSEAVREFVLGTFKRVHDRDIDEFLDEEFDRGLRDGSWLLLFDSFDEIPDVLGATESDATVDEYAEAVHNFLIGMKGCRGVIASREFRGPRSFQVPRFRIVPLTRRRQRDLVRRSGLPPARQDVVLAGLAAADAEFEQLALNPMYLGLVCEHVRVTGEFAPAGHLVHETYIAQRFARDADRVLRRYGVRADLVRAVAEEAAFCMAAEPGLGLSPARADLRRAILRQGRLSVTRLTAVLDALEYSKLGRGDGEDQAKVFTFAHRRFQEYFATCVVLREPGRVPVRDLLTDGRWRETAVTILQTQPEEAVKPLLVEVTSMLDGFAAQVRATPDTGGEVWPPGALHLIGLCNAGLGAAPDTLPAAARSAIAEILTCAWDRGRRYDRRWATELSLVADRATTLRLLEDAFASGASAVRGAAYTAVGRVADPPAHLYRHIRLALMEMARSGRLRENRQAVNAQIRRLPEPRPLLQLARLLRVHQAVDWVCVFVVVTLVWGSWAAWWTDWRFMDGTTLALSTAFPSLYLVATVAAGVRRDQLIGADAPRCRRRLIVHLALRGAGAAALILFIIIGHGLTTMMVETILVVALALWPIAVRHAVLHGCARSVLSWPLLPLRLAHSLPGGTVQMMRTIRSNLVPILGVVAGSGLMVALEVWGSHWITKFVEPWGEITSGVILALGTVYWLRGRIREMRGRRHDLALVRKVVEEGGQPDAARLTKLLDRLRTTKGTAELIAVTVRRGLDDASVRFLDDIAETIEVTRHSAGQPPAVGPEFARWLDGHGGRLPYRLTRLPEATLGLITKLVEERRLARENPG